MSQFESYAMSTLRRIQSKYEPGSTEWIEIQALIGLQRFRFRHGEKAYREVRDSSMFVSLLGKRKVVDAHTNSN